jgi:hypothetical protein
MTTTSSPAHRTVASLGRPAKVPALIVFAQNVYKAMTGNPHFPSPTPTLAVLAAAIAALSTAETATLTRTVGAVTARNTARSALVTMLQQIKGYVQLIADGDPENSVSIIQSAGLGVRKPAARGPRTFTARAGDVAGSAKLVAPTAARRASYEWEYSADGGKTWVTAPPSLQAKTVVTGLPSGTSVQFRFRAVTKAGGGDWSVPVTLPVK